MDVAEAPGNIRCRGLSQSDDLQGIHVFGERIQDLLAQPMSGPQSLNEVEGPSRELSQDEVLEIAIRLQQGRRFAEACAVFDRLLKADPNHPRTLHFAGVLAHQMGQKEHAVDLIRRSLELGPDRADWHSNLGVVLQEQGRWNEAIRAYRRAIALDGTHANAFSNLGVTLRAAGKPAEAEAAYRAAIRIDPCHVDAHLNLGVLLCALMRSEESIACFRTAARLKRKHGEGKTQVALAHCMRGEVAQAITIFDESLAEEPDDPIARHMLAACTGRDVPDRACDRFIQLTFDRFAPSFESTLASLGYRAPALVAAILDDSGHEPVQAMDVLDAGCGTGLCGPLIAPFARFLTGVDLSGAMLAKARDKGVYDDLQQQELTGYLRNRPEAFDIIVSADTLVYFGALDEVVAVAAHALRPGGLLIFTLERATIEPAPDFHLEIHGRYTHGHRYVERLLTAAGLSSEIAHADLRMESGVPVAGLVVRARKRSLRGRRQGPLRARTGRKESQAPDADQSVLAMPWRMANNASSRRVDVPVLSKTLVK